MPIYDTDAFIKAGVQPTKKMLKYCNSIDQNGRVVVPNLLKYNLNYDSLLDIMREQNRIETLERYQWINLPFGVTADIIERLLYYRGKGVLYYNDNVDKFQFLPFALSGVIDEYGRYTKVNTFPFTGVDIIQKKDSSTNKKEMLVYQDLEIVYDIPYSKEMIDKVNSRKPVGIILNDSSIGISQQPIIRYNYVTPILRLLATIIQIINASIFGAADHSTIQVENEGELDSINQQIEAINLDILAGRRFTPVVSKLPITPIKTGNTVDLEGLFNTFNSVNNLLKSITGISNAGVFDKKAHLLQEEQELNGSNADDIYYNGLRERQEFCLLVQAYYQYPIWCESKRGMSGAQAEDVAMGDDQDPTNTTQVQQGVNNNAND